MKKYSKEQMEQLSLLMGYSNKYEISIQFWPDQTAVYISKDGVELTSYGGSYNHAINSSLDYLNRINKKNKL